MKKHSIRTQFMGMVILLTVCFTVLSLAAYKSVCDLLSKTNHGYAMNSSLTYSYSMNDLYQRVNNISALLSANADVQEFVSSPLDQNTITLVRRLSDIFFNYTATNLDIADISIVGRQSYRSTIYSTSMLSGLWARMNNRRGIQCLGMIDARLFTQNETPTPYLVFGFNLFSSGVQEPNGCLLFSVNFSHFAASSLISSYQTAQIAQHFLGIGLNDDFYTLWGDAAAAQTAAADIHANAELFKVSAAAPLTLSTERYDYVCLLLPQSDFFIISAIDKRALLTDLDGALRYVILAIALFMVFLLLTFFLLLRGVVMPLRVFSTRIKTIRCGDRKAMRKPLHLEGCREIKELSDEFSGMLTQILSLEEQLFTTMKNLYDTDIERQKAEIAHLRSQINPHFLYNTLESIKGIAIRHGIPEIADIATAIGKISRYSIKGAVTVTLAKEMEIVDAYLRIQKMRFENRFEAIVSIPENCRRLMVPKMLLQPLAENAVCHGLENCQGGTLYISASRTEDDLRVIVQDDGEGMSEERLNGIRQQLESADADESRQIGLLNIHRRIRLSCGEKYGLTIDSALHCGTKVMVLLPVAEAKEAQECTEF